MAKQQKPSERQLVHNDLNECFKLPAFRRLIRGLLREWDIMAPSMTGDRFSEWHEGRRSAARDVKAVLDDWDPHAFLILLKEEVDDDQRGRGHERGAALGRDEADDE